MTQTLTIPAPAKWISANARDHWAVKARLTRAWRTAARIRARQLRPCTTPVHVTVTIHKSHRGHPNWDVANVAAPTAKACIDGLRDAGVLPDDSTRWVVSETYQAGEPAAKAALVLTLTPIDPMTHPQEGPTT